MDGCAGGEGGTSVLIEWAALTRPTLECLSLSSLAARSSLGVCGGQFCCRCTNVSVSAVTLPTSKYLLLASLFFFKNKRRLSFPSRILELETTMKYEFLRYSGMQV